MKTICRRLRRGDDLLRSIEQIAREEGLEAAVIVSGVGCVSHARVRDASGVTVREIGEPCEIVSLDGTVSAARCHVHIALAREDLSTLGGHLMPGCIVNTTCELALLALDYAREQGFKRCYLETTAFLTEAIGLYEHLGFEHIDGPLGCTGHVDCEVRMLKTL